jgi:membrane protease YdiL (CAAX protease family)
LRTSGAYRLQMLSEKHWRPTLVLLLGALVFLSIVGGILAASIAARLFSPRLDPNSEALLTLVIMVFGFQGLAIVWVNEFLKMHEVSWGAAFGFAQPNYGRCTLLVLILLPLVLVVIFALGAGSNWVLDRLHEQTHWPWLKPELQPTVQLLQQKWPPYLIAVQGLVTIVIAPVAEEILFRGVLYTAIKQRGHRQLALWTSALLFAVIHGYPVGFLSLIFLSMMFVFVYERTKNLFAPILLHSLFNTVNFVLIVVKPRWAEGLFNP